MIKIKTFRLEEDEAFNAFVAEHPARDEGSVKFGSTHIVVVYEEGEPISLLEKITNVSLKMRVHEKKILEYKQQYYSFKRQSEKADEVVKNMQEEIDSLTETITSLKKQNDGEKDKEVKISRSGEITENNRKLQNLKQLLQNVKITNDQKRSSVVTSKGQLELEKTDMEATAQLLEELLQEKESQE